MGLLDGKIALIFGVANKNSIGWGIAKAIAAGGRHHCLELCHRQTRASSASLG